MSTLALNRLPSFPMPSFMPISSLDDNNGILLLLTSGIETVLLSMKSINGIEIRTNKTAGKNAGVVRSAGWITESNLSSSIIGLQGLKGFA
jgi:hypothetical protein